jgi:hypothetical protein
MSMTTLHGPHGVLRIEREEIEVTSNMPRPDRAWTFADAQGHAHHWRDGWPTLTWVVDDEAWCDDCNDTHQEGHWECVLCGEPITPGMTSASPYREFLPGLATCTLNGYPIAASDAQRIVEAMRDSRA